MSHVNPMDKPTNWEPVYNSDTQITGYEYTDKNGTKKTINPYEYNNITNINTQKQFKHYEGDNIIGSGGSHKRSRRHSKKQKRVRHTRRKQTRRHRHRHSRRR